MEKILASCCQHVNGIRFEESTMTKYRPVRTGRGEGAPCVEIGFYVCGHFLGIRM